MSDLLKDGYKLWEVIYDAGDIEGVYVAKTPDDVNAIRAEYYGTDELTLKGLTIKEKELKHDEPAYVEDGKTIMIIDLYNDVVAKGELGDQIIWFE